MLSLWKHEPVPPPSAAFPAKAGIQSVDYRSRETVWVPPREGGDCAGKAEGGRGPRLRGFANKGVDQVTQLFGLVFLQEVTAFFDDQVRLALSARHLFDKHLFAAL